MWLHPLFFSILVLQKGHSATLCWFLSNHSFRVSGTTWSQVCPSCHLSRHLKQTSVPQCEHVKCTSVSSLAFMNFPQLAFGHHRISLLASRLFYSAKRFFLSYRSWWLCSRRISSSFSSDIGAPHSKSKQLSLSISAFSICTCSCWMTHSLQKRCLHSNSIVSLSSKRRGLLSGVIKL